MYYLSGWHVKPRGVKKPYVCGAFISRRLVQRSLTDTTPYWASSSGADMTIAMGHAATILLSKVHTLASLSPDLTHTPVSHHPPVSAYFYISPQNGLRISGELKPKSRFLGNSVSTVMDGENRVFLTRRSEDGGRSNWPLLENHDSKEDRIPYQYAQYVRTGHSLWLHDPRAWGHERRDQ